MNKQKSDSITRKVGERIRSIRESLNLMQKEFAKKLEISAPSLSEIETGRNRPGIEFLIKLSEKFNVNLYYVLLGKGEMFTNPILDYFIKAKNYARNVDDVREFLDIFSRSKDMQYFIINEFRGKMLREGKLILENIIPNGLEEE